MSQNPISRLQETLIKLNIEPKYEMIEEMRGTQGNKFTVILQCGSKWPSVTKTGFSKKDAKYKAAESMLQLIMPHCSTFNVSAKDISKDDEDSRENWIGKLKEKTDKVGKIEPYYDCHAVGSAHNPTFTVTCSYNNSTVDATGRTKKIAKNLAAKCMYQKIMGKYSFNFSDKDNAESEVGMYTKIILSEMDKIQIEESDMLFNYSVEKAKGLYSHLSLKNFRKSAPELNEIDFLKYYMYLKSDIESKGVANKFMRLKEIMLCCKSVCNSKNEIDCLNQERPMELFRELLNDLCISFVTNYHQQKNNYIFWITLDTSPVTVEIGLGKNVKVAEILAIFQVCMTVSILLK
ncbi:uncharacterized protein LOC106637038 [Copidosoma floridanum]|uniref:uncharacterized protein LOC106637038 n=1 Tax=Copidosoma floridanum TaxID=29053 RepID=UPI0006C9D21C|nr:uncharacterized protein LOC106637038 [Copidosoma floridanum]XP_014205151.1 uncharacterized protein LOC106637038 [Copidosoma floridanum]